MTQHWIIWITSTFVLFFVTISLGEEHPTIETSLGTIRGHYKHSYGSRKYAAYEGIPYAKPPIGHLRFEEPIETEPWTGIWDATLIHTCFQITFFTPEPFGSEDCLYLNVYVPEGNHTNLDVIVHIHGGAFMMGNPEIGGPYYLMDRNVVYVNLNYRLGALGFLSTEDDVVPGNNGMKDQVLALQWVQKHIERFGGNPSSVTITGVSAGSVATHLHYFSPLSKGLFHRGMSQGGTALAPWAIHRAPLKKAIRLATSIGCNNTCTREMVKCLKERPARQVVQNSYADSPIPGFPLAPFSPVVERKSPGAFLIDDPYTLLKSGNINDVPWIAGSTTEEGILGLNFLGFKFDYLNKHWDSALDHVLNYQDTVEQDRSVEVAQKIKEFYLDSKELSNDNVQSFIKLYGDRCFHISLEKSTRLQTKVSKSSIYSYIYGYRNDLEPSKLFPSSRSLGVDHSSDAHLLYEMKFGQLSNVVEGKLSKSDARINEFLLDVVTYFAKNGKPISDGVTWEPMEDGPDFRHLFIHNDGLKMVSKDKLTPVEFWESLPLKEYDHFVLKRDEL